jgi:hypothetical protein
LAGRKPRVFRNTFASGPKGWVDQATSNVAHAPDTSRGAAAASGAERDSMRLLDG